MTPLAIALAALIALPSGALPRHVRDLGGASYVAHVAAWTESAAGAEQLPVSLLAALLIAESQLNVNAVSSIGARGLGQLNVRTPLGREWLAACRLANDDMECAEMNVRVSARALRAALVRCRGDRRCAIGVYRFGHIAKPRPRDHHVVLLAQRIAFRMRRQTALVAWKAGGS